MNLAAVVGLSRSDGGAALPSTLADADDATVLMNPSVEGSGRAYRSSSVRSSALGAAGAVVTIVGPSSG